MTSNAASGVSTRSLRLPVRFAANDPLYQTLPPRGRNDWLRKAGIWFLILVFGLSSTTYTYNLDYNPAKSTGQKLFPQFFGIHSIPGDNANYNRLTEKQTSQVDATVLVDKAFHYNERDQLTDIQDHLDTANRVTYQFDANGNQVQKVKGTETSDFVFDARNHLRQVTVGGSTVGQFLYDASGMRVEKKIGSE